MAFRVETLTRASRVVIVCEGHLDDEAAGVIARGLAAAEGAGLEAVVRVRPGVTADRPAVARLAAYPAEQLEVESPFLRSWLEEVRATRAEAAPFGSREPSGSGSETR